MYRVLPDGERSHCGQRGDRGGGDGFPALETGLDEVRGVWVLESGGLLLGTQTGSQVWHVDASGIIRLLVDGARGIDAHVGDGQPFDAPGKKVTEVRNVTMDPGGNLLITENDDGVIRMVRRR